jgi:uncharacterized protein YwqG
MMRRAPEDVKSCRDAVSSRSCAQLAPGEEPAFQAQTVLCDWSETEFEQYAKAREGTKIGGVPLFLQNDAFPDDGEWRLLLQLDSTQVPFSVNVGDAGLAYVFVDPTGQRAKMLWQCG